MNDLAKQGHLTIHENPEIRKQIMEFQETMLNGIKSGDLKEVPSQLNHYFAPGMYARELFIPKGTLYVGKIHKHPHIRVISKGSVSILTEEGDIFQKAPCTMVTPAGAKRIGFAHEDTVITTIHLTNETDLDKIEEEIIAKDYDELLPRLEEH